MHYQSPSETGSELTSNVEMYGSAIRSLVEVPEPDAMAYVPREGGTGQGELRPRRGYGRREGASGSASGRLPEKQANNDLIAKKEHISRVLRSCREMLEDIVEIEDPIQVSNEAHALMREFKSLWQYRDARESEWGDLINLLQIALPGQNYEDVPKQTWIAISRIFEECLANRTLRNDDTRRAIRLLKEAGLDPWNGISGPVIPG